jgi:16S rRNA C1402 N4-methylase RsmH
VKNLKPSEIEINNNKRSRSATLRIIERIKWVWRKIEQNY